MTLRDLATVDGGHSEQARAERDVASVTQRRGLGRLEFDGTRQLVREYPVLAIRLELAVQLRNAQLVKICRSAAGFVSDPPT